MKDSDNTIRKKTRKEKRRARLSHLCHSTHSVSFGQGQDVPSPSPCSAILSSIASRPSRRETRRKVKKFIGVNDVETGVHVDDTPVKAKEGSGLNVYEAPASDNDTEDQSEFEESQLESLYSIPGAFRVSRKIVNNRTVEDITLGEASIESYSTAKTPPFVVTQACLVDEGSKKDLNDQPELVYPERNVIFVSRRHLCIFIALSCLAVGGLVTGVVFALYEPTQQHSHSDTIPTDDGAPSTFLEGEASYSEAPSTKIPYPGGPMIIPGAPSMQPSLRATSFGEAEDFDTMAPMLIPTSFPTVSPTSPIFQPIASTPTPSIRTNPAFSLTQKPTVPGNEASLSVATRAYSNGNYRESGERDRNRLVM